MLRLAQLAVFGDFIAACRRFDIRPAQYSVLTVIDYNPGINQTELSGALGIKRANLVGMIDDLERRGLVQRRRAVRDRRTFGMFLTDHGRALMLEVHVVVRAHDQRVTRKLRTGGRDQHVKMAAATCLLVVGFADAAAQSVAPAPAAAQTAPSAQRVEVVLPTSHIISVNSVVLSADDEDRFAASGGEHGLIKLWDVNTGRLIRNLTTTKGSASGSWNWHVTALSSDGKRVVARPERVDVGRWPAVWDTVTGRKILTIEDQPYDNPIALIATSQVSRTLTPQDRYDIIISNDGARIASRRKDAVKLHDGLTGKQLATLSDVVAVSFSRDGKQIVAGRPNRTVDILDSTTGLRIRALTTLDGVMVGVAHSNDGRRISIQSASGLVKLWDLEKSQQIAERRGTEKTEAVFSSDGAYWAFANGKGTVEILNVQSGAITSSFTAPANSSLARFSRDGAFLLFEGSDVTTVRVTTGEIVKVFKSLASAVRAFGNHYYIEGSEEPDVPLRLWDIESGHDARTFAGQSPGAIYGLSPDGARVAQLRGGEMSVLDAETGQPVGGCPAPADDLDHRSVATEIAFSPDDRQLAYTRVDMSIAICDLEKRTITRPLTGHTHRINTLSFSADGRQLISGDSDMEGSDRNVKIWEIASGRNVRAFKADATVVAFSPDARRAFTLETVAGGTSRVHVWNIETGREERNLRTPYFPIAMAISADGRRVAVGGKREFLVKQWDVETGKELRRLEGGEANDFTNVNDLKFSMPDDRFMAAIWANKFVVWDIDSGQKKLSVNVPGGELLKSIAFSGDGRRLVTVDDDGVIRHWDRKAGTLLVTVLSFDDGDWLRLTPEGFFDSSANAAASLSVVRGLDISSIDQVYQALYRPDLVRSKLAGDPDGRVKEAAANLDLDRVMASGAAPRVTVVSPQSGARIADAQVTAQAIVTDAGGGIGRIEWRVNGVTLGVTPRGLAPTSTTPVNTATVTRSLPLVAGDNVIEVVAYNEKDLIASPAARLRLRRTGDQVDASPRLHVVAVGVNEHWDGRLKLNFAVNDARAIAEAFEKVAKGLYDSVKVTTVLDVDVTRDHLGMVFAQVAGEVRPSDVFVLFIAGHGKTLDSHYYFIPYDFRYQDQSSFARSAISQDQWQQWMAAIPARKSILIYDTCESGTVTADQPASRGLVAIEEQATAIEKLRQATGRTVLAASTETEPALEGIKGHGVLSYAVLEALQKGPVNKDGLIEVTGLISFVDDEVPALSFQAFKRRQIPQAKFNGSNFPFGKPTPVLAAAGDVAPTVSEDIRMSPTHVVITAAGAEVFSEPGGGAPPRHKLAVGTPVTLVKTEQGWTLVAQEGKPLGYVASNGLAPIK